MEDRNMMSDDKIVGYIHRQYEIQTIFVASADPLSGRVGKAKSACRKQAGGRLGVAVTGQTMLGQHELVGAAGTKV